MRRYQAVLSLFALLLLAVVATPASAKVRSGPSGDAFYTPPSPLPGKKHGDLIWARRLTGSAALASAHSNTLVLYRSVGSNGKPIAVSGTVSIPKGKAPKRGWPVITYGHGTTGIADQCAPSRDSQSDPAHAYIAYIYPLLNHWLDAGFAVVRTDYQGLGTPGAHEFLVGKEEGRSTLDIVRAALRLNPHLRNRVAIAGHSQGGHASLWAAALAPKYAPGIKIRATVAFAPQSHTGEELSLVSAIKTPGGLTGLASMVIRAVDVFRPSVNVPSLLTDKATALYPETLTKCLPQLNQPDSFGGLAPADLFRDGADTTAFRAALEASDPENLRITLPLDVEQGTADNTVFPALTDDLVKQLRGRGTKIVYRKYDKVTHSGVVVAAEAHSTKYLRKRLK